jgi:hypothetical protein
MTNMPRIAQRKPSEKFQAYADRYREAVEAYASLLGSTHDIVQRQRLEAKLQNAREQAAFNQTKAQEARERGE